MSILSLHIDTSARDYQTRSKTQAGGRGELNEEAGELEGTLSMWNPKFEELSHGCNASVACVTDHRRWS